MTRTSAPLRRARLDPAGFLGERQATVAARTLPHVMARCEETGRLRNFDRAAGVRGDAFEGRFYDDSDVYKTLEGAAHATAEDAPTRPGEGVAEASADWIRRIVRAQSPDGYLNTFFQTHPEEPRFADVRWKHELYCLGHLVEAAVAWQEVRGRPDLLAAARGAVDHVAGVFGPHGRRDPPGHPELELALLRLFEHGGDARDLALARFFLEQRGQDVGRERFGELCQDHAPLRAQREVRGHAVRATYLFAAATDLARLDRDASWDAALDALWDDLVGRKMYVTGGIGSSARNEGFTDAWDLPNEEAYAETCASIGLALWAARMARRRRDARYADVLERALLNGVLAGLSRAGDAFFYVNPLASRGGVERKPFFDTACCPTNLARFLPALPTLVCRETEAETFVDLFAAGSVPFGAEAFFEVRTRYPWEGDVLLVLRAPRPLRRTLCLRVPGFSAQAELWLADRRVACEPEDGYFRLVRTWRDGDEVRLSLDLQVERLRADPRVRANDGRVALRRGPLVYAVEGVDHDGRVLDLCLPREAPVRTHTRPDLGLDVVGLSAEAARTDGRPTTLRAVPYALWANRGAGEMAVWLPEAGGPRA